MSKYKLNQPQSIFINRSQVLRKIGIPGQDFYDNQLTSEQIITHVDIVETIGQTEELINSSNLPDTRKNSTIEHIETTIAFPKPLKNNENFFSKVNNFENLPIEVKNRYEELVQHKEPQKNVAARSLQQTTEGLNNADEIALVAPEDDEPIDTTNPIKELIKVLVKPLLDPGEPRWTTTYPGSDTTLITYSFTGVDSNPNDDLDTVPMNENQRYFAISALGKWHDIANIDFRYDPTGNGQIVFEMADLAKYIASLNNIPRENLNIAGYCKGNTGERAFVFLDNNYLKNPSNYNPKPGTDGFDTLLHEIGHALGLKHPGNYDAGGNLPDPPFLSEWLDDNLYTVMSYNDKLSRGNECVTPMVLDIAAIQYLYGASDRSSNNTYSWDANSFAATIWDNGGLDDSIDINDDAFRSKIDLGQTNGGSGIPIEPSLGLPTTRSSIFRPRGVSDIVIPNGVVIENVSGASGQDEIYGNAANNYFQGFDGDDKLYGFDGNDKLYGGAGIDFLDGGVGDDTLVGGSSSDIYIVDSLGDVVVEEDSDSVRGGVDEVRSSSSYTLGDRIEELILTGEAAINGTGNSLNNYITGNTAINVLIGGEGDDSLSGKDGDDFLFGGNNNDQLQGDLGSDYLSGGFGDDIYIADEFDIIVEVANAGNDTIRSDSITILPDNVENKESLNPQQTNAVNFTGNGLSNQITGNAGNNFLNGLAGDDILKGLDGNDTLIGDNGDDTLTGGLGNDTLNGGAGIDTVKESGNFATFDLRDTSLKAYDSPSQLIETDTLINIESASLTGGSGNNSLYAYFFTKGSVSLFGEGGNDVLNGGSGNDILDGGSGNDVLSGNAGNDTLNGRSGSDILGGGNGNDILIGGDAANDVFSFGGTADFSSANLGIDRIEDFGNGPDRIVLDKTVFTALQSKGGTGYTVFGFSVASEFAKVASDALAATSEAFITYSSATGNLFYNQNGANAGLGSGGQFATLANLPDLTATDFCIIL